MERAAAKLFLASGMIAVCALMPLLTSAATLGDPDTNALTNGLVGYWPLDGGTTNWTTGTTFDLSGQGNTGSLLGMSTTTSPVQGRVGQALKFNGASYIDAGNGSSLNITGPVTVSIWVRLSSLPASNEDFISKYDGTNVGYIMLLTSAGSLRFYTGGAGANSANATVTTNLLNTWINVVGEYDGTNTKIYVNGVAQTNAITPLAPVVASTDLNIGRRASGVNFTSGTLDDVRIYNRALSATEIALLYATGNANIGAAPKNAVSSGLIGYWPLDGSLTNWKTGLTSDISGQGNNLSLVNLSTTTSPVQGKIGQALKFNGNNQYLSHASISALNFGSGDFAVSFWMKPLSPWGSGTIGVIGQKTSDSFNGWQIYQDSGHLSHLDMRITSSHNFLTTATVPTGSWTYATFVRSGGNIYWYLNGKLDASNTDSSSISDTGLFYVGYAPTWTAYYPGILDDIRIYNRALSATEVAALYATGAVNPDHSNTSSGISLNSGLVGYWTFDGPNTNWKTGTELDSSGQGNNGSLIRMSTTTSPTQGKVGQALKFNGANQYIALPTISGITLGSPTFKGSVTFWVKNGGNYPALSVERTGGLQGTLAYIVAQAGSPFQYTNCDLGVPPYCTTIQSAATIPSSGWSFVAFTGDGNHNYQLAVNGQVTAVSHTFGTPDAGNFPVIDIGREYNYSYGTYYWTGTIDDVRIYNRALSATEIAQLYKMEK